MKVPFRHYPISLLLGIVIIYLSCFKPPKNSLEEIPNMDKVVHFSMYCCFSLLVWFEYLRFHHFGKKRLLYCGLLFGFIIPALLGASMELVQKYLTTYRAFEWGDILANTSGAFVASLFAAFYIIKYCKDWFLLQITNIYVFCCYALPEYRVCQSHW